MLANRGSNVQTLQWQTKANQLKADKFIIGTSNLDVSTFLGWSFSKNDFQSFELCEPIEALKMFEKLKTNHKAAVEISEFVSQINES